MARRVLRSWTARGRRPARWRRQKAARRGRGSGSSFEMLHVDLHVFQAVEFVDCQPIGGADPVGLLRGLLGGVEAHGLVAPAFLPQLQLEVALADDTTRFDVECIAEERLRKALAPDLRLQHARYVERAMRRVEAAVGLENAKARARRQHLFQRALERAGEALVFRRGDRQAGGLRMPAEARDQSRLALGDEIDAVAKMQAGNGPARTFEHGAAAL